MLRQVSIPEKVKISESEGPEIQPFFNPVIKDFTANRLEREDIHI
jgi:hypothetical protein